MCIRDRLHITRKTYASHLLRNAVIPARQVYTDGARIGGNNKRFNRRREWEWEISSNIAGKIRFYRANI